MKIDGVPYRSIWVDPDEDGAVRIIDQTRLPWTLEIVRLETLEQAAHAIRAMQVRGAPLIGATAAYGLCLALRADAVHRGDGARRRRCSPRPDRPRSICAGRSIGC